MAITTIPGIEGPVSVTQLARVGQDTYAANLVGYAGYATPTDMFIIRGSATKIVRISNMRMLIGTTSGALQILRIVKRTAVNTGGTKAALTDITQFDSTSPAPTAVAETYSVIPASLGAGTNIAVLPGVTTVLTAAPAAFQLANALSGGNPVSFLQGIVLRGVAESLCCNWNGAALPAGFAAQCEVVWTESDT